MTPQLIRANNPGAYTGKGNNTFLVGTVLIDAGVGEAAHVAAIATALGGDALSHVVVTHGHSDHASGVPALGERWPDLRRSKHFPDGTVADGWSALNEGDRVDVGERSLRVLVTPGHAADHICLFEEVTGDLFVGDMVIAGTTVLVPSKSKGGSMRAYLQSLARLRDLDAGRLLPGHGPVIERPRDRIDAIIQHRLEREAQVAACVRQGLTEPALIVARIYEGLPALLLPFAEQTVIAHLEKLDEDGYAG
jgi:glyoxylase-like metal-dependent hydrolase (beta-lactamase superfamily II)